MATENRKKVVALTEEAFDALVLKAQTKWDKIDRPDGKPVDPTVSLMMGLQNLAFASLLGNVIFGMDDDDDDDDDEEETED